MVNGLLEFWFCLVPLFVAVDPIGLVPMFISLTEGFDPHERNKLIRQSVMTATLVAVAFIMLGPAVMRLLNITVADFMIAGGALLFVISLSDMLRDGHPQRMVDPESVGAVPIGVPLITGPAVLTTSVLLSDQHGAFVTAVAAVVNVLIVGVVFTFSGHLYRILGKAGSKTISKIASLLLAAIAVMIVRRGVIAAVQAVCETVSGS